MEKQARALTKKAHSTYTEETFTSWKEWPLQADLRKRIEAAVENSPNQEMVIGRIDRYGGVLGLFGELPGLKNISGDKFVKRDQHLLEIVLVEDKALVGKDFRGDRLNFTQEWYNLAFLYGKANLPAVYKVDEKNCCIYRNLVLGPAVRDLLVDAGARILPTQTKDDPELTVLDEKARIEAVWARGRSYIQSCLSEEFILNLEEQLNKVHACGVTGVSLTFGNIIVDYKNNMPWFVDFDRARVHRSSLSPIFLYKRNQDRVKFNKLYG